jgi:hypothetical protein
MDPTWGKLGLLAKGRSEQANLASNAYRILISWQKQALVPDDFGGERKIR